VRERFGSHVASAHTLKPVVTDSRSRVDGRFDVSFVDQMPLLGSVRPNPGEAIGLEFKPNRERVRLAGILFLKPVDFRLNAEDLLHMVAELMGDHIGLSELAGRTEFRTELIEEGEVEIDLLVFGTVKRAGGFTRRAAAGIGRIAEENEFGVAIRAVFLGGKDLVPGVLNVVQEGRDIAHFRRLAILRGSKRKGQSQSRKLK